MMHTTYSDMYALLQTLHLTSIIEHIVHSLRNYLVCIYMTMTIHDNDPHASFGRSWILL